MNLSQAATAVGISRQRVHQIARKKGIGTPTPSKRSGQRQRWHFSQEDVNRMSVDHTTWASERGIGESPWPMPETADGRP